MRIHWFSYRQTVPECGSWRSFRRFDQSVWSFEIWVKAKPTGRGGVPTRADPLGERSPVATAAYLGFGVVWFRRPREVDPIRLNASQLRRLIDEDGRASFDDAFAEICKQ